MYPPDNGGLYSCLAAVLVLLGLIFPGLFVLRNSITAFTRKLQQTQTASNLRKAQRDYYARTVPIVRDTSPLPRDQDDLMPWPETTLQTRTLIRKGSFRQGEATQAGCSRQTAFPSGYSREIHNMGG